MESAVASRALADQEESGDAAMVRVFPQTAVIAAVDGLGHGAAAASAARQAVAILGESDAANPAAALERCHAALRSTRGVTLSFACFDGGRGVMTWCGVGGVQGVLVRSDPEATPREVALLLKAGVVGRQLPAVHAATLKVAPGDLLIFTTDGISPHFARSVSAGDSPRRIADRILARHWLGSDDALVVTARYRGVEA
ncbi:MAG: SpoIIE family protein phosphatase [Candidatus Eisenbacteria bacterium]|nr:SpoIIE family protein phosphatase [Candidatus Eisenbacteria bacterium]